ncbi:unannotated protein [freshwater metagenome]|uniref:Unannotated protein n=1 Tax=freshwater metagenome TaxID=449393 RepID=A0A6J7C376_9ZZZZ
MVASLAMARNRAALAAYQRFSVSQVLALTTPSAGVTR